MLTCRDITALATEFAEGQLAGAVRRDFMEHVAGCRGCATWVDQLERSTRAVRALPAPTLPGALRHRLEARFEAWSGERRPGRLAGATRPGVWTRVDLAPALGSLAAFGLLVGLAHAPSSSPTDWTLALGMLAGAVLIVALRRRVTHGVAAAGAAAALLAAAVTGAEGAPEAAGGLECLVTVFGVSSGGAAAAWFVSRRESPEILGATMGTWAVAGALVAAAALEVACGARSSMAHQLTVHAGGLIAVTAIAYLSARWIAAAARA